MTNITWDVGTRDVYLEVQIENYSSKINYKYQWFKGSTAIKERENLTANKQRLVFKGITIDDEGEYYCQVDDGIDIVINSTPCEVKVNTESPCMFVFLI